MPQSRSSDWLSSDRLSSEDAMFLYLEKKEMPLHIGSVSIFDGAISLDSLTALVESKLPLIPRYRQRIVAPPLHFGHPTWEYDPTFDIRRHMRRVSLQRGSDAEVQAVAGQVFSEVMDRDRPLWDMTLIDGLKRGHTAVIARVHHCLVDGVAGIALFNVLMDTTREVPPLPKKKPFHAPPLPDAATSFIDALLSSTTQMMDGMLLAEAATIGLAQALVGNHARTAVENWLGFVPDLMTSLDRLPFNAPVLGPRQHLWTEMSIREITAIRDECGGTLNDVALTVVTAAVRRYAERHGQSVANRLLRFWVPVNLRTPGEQPGTGNRISILPVLTPLDIREPVKLLQAVHESTAAMKRSHILDLVNLAAAWASATPPPLQALFGMLGNVLPIPPFHLVCTNVPGPKSPVYLLGRKMLRTYPYVPIGNDMGFCCAMQSYNGRLYTGLTADVAVVPDAQKMREFMEEAYAELRDAADVKTRKRPKPRVRRTPAPTEANTTAVAAPAEEVSAETALVG
jgi:diacylglycerol O-acyltransferase / wax synthase